ncbi:MAG: molybdopterin-synthase adenylyltransferase MoeB [Opitutales bacterium]|jgi:adenylyltransferase/sulfurtransferase
MDTASTFSREELTRYHRQIILPGMGRYGQERLKAARVLIVGMGGLGSPVAMYLAASGVGTLGIADFDRVELHNLHRQIVHDTPRVGVPKVESAIQTLSAINPHCNFVPHPEGVRAESLPGLLGGYDVVVDCTDNFPTRYMLNDAAVLAKKPLVYGSIHQYEGQASFFHPAEGAPCYRCLFPEMPDPASVPNCAEAGVIGALCGIIGSIQAMEAIKFITGVGETLAGRLLVIDAATMATRTLNIKRDPTCPVCSRCARIRNIVPAEYEWSCAGPNENMSVKSEITSLELKEFLDGPNPPLLLDVREEDECAVGMIGGAINIPMAELGMRMRELSPDRLIVAYCLSGLRSMRAQKFMQSRGFAQVLNLRGGILTWIRDVDPDMSAY